MSNIVFEKNNPETGMSARVVATERGFVANLYDLDAEVYVASAIICPTFEQAKAKALTFVGSEYGVTAEPSAPPAITGALYPEVAAAL